MIKILAYKYPASPDVTLKRQVEPLVVNVTKETIQDTIKTLLFVNKYNYVLIGLNNKLFICEATEPKEKQYSRREIAYHPHEARIFENK